MSREEIILDFIKNTIISLKDVLKPDELKTLCDAYVEIKQCEPKKEYNEWQAENLLMQNLEYKKSFSDILSFVDDLEEVNPEMAFELRSILNGDNNIPKI